MANTNFQSIDEYIATKPKATQTTLKRVRAIIRKAVPGAVEAISYQIPAYKVDGKTALFFAGWKEHYALYPATGGLIEAFKEELAAYEVSKGTIRFPLTEPIPVKLIAGIARFRAEEAAARAAAKAAPKRAAKKAAIKEAAKKGRAQRPFAARPKTRPR